MIGIIAAMDIEVDAIRAVSEITGEQQIADCQIYVGKIGSKDIVLCKSGVGKTHAAMAATILCMYYQPQAIINVGTAGGLLAQQKVLDIVISSKVVQADFDTSAIDGPQGIGLTYQPSEKMVQLCTEAALRCGVTYHIGTIASQDLFMARDADFARLMERFPEAACSEMEAGAVAQVAQSFEVPYIIVRCLSDVVHHNENPMEFSEYAQKASVQSASLIEAFTQRL